LRLVMVRPWWVTSMARPRSCMEVPGLAVGGEHAEGGHVEHGVGAGAAVGAAHRDLPGRVAVAAAGQQDAVTGRVVEQRLQGGGQGGVGGR
jgi:hypothetical protein